LTVADAATDIEANFHVHMIRQTIHDLLKHDPRVNSYRKIQMEDKGIEVREENIRGFVARSIEKIDRVRAHFLFNMDEMKHREWADQRSKSVSFPQHPKAIMSESRCGALAKRM
jgi:hypothetical protein